MIRNPMFDVITIGSATRDVFLQNVDFNISKSQKSKTGQLACLPLGSKIEIEDIVFETGGGGTNSAFTFANLGLNAAVYSRVGEDVGGREIIKLIKDKGINIKYIVRDDKRRTAYSLILLTPEGKRTILVHRGASSHLAAKEIPWNKIKTKWFYITSLGGNMALLKKLITFARENDIKVAVNPGSLELKQGLKKLKPLLNKTDILILNREEMSGLVGASFGNLKQIIKKSKENFGVLTVITDGEKGAYVIQKSGAVHAPTFDVKIINTTGAGDAFGAAFASGMILKNDPDYALRIGILNSNSVIQKMGAKAGLLKSLPSTKDLQRVKIKKI